MHLMAPSFSNVDSKLNRYYYIVITDKEDIVSLTDVRCLYVVG